jgi:hypothetical protein
VTPQRAAKWHRINPGHYRHTPTGYEVKQAVRNGGLWRLYDGGGHVVFSAPRLYTVKAWVRECAP